MWISLKSVFTVIVLKLGTSIFLTKEHMQTVQTQISLEGAV